jgi:hypothetical protein
MIGTSRRPGSRDAWTALAGGLAAVGVLVTVSACGASSGTSARTTAAPTTRSTSPTAGAGSAPAGAGRSSGPAVVESNPPGDIPDNQAFVPYTGSGFTVSIPEGWGRSFSGSTAVFSDKYNSITVASAAATQPPTIGSATTLDLPTIQASSQGFAPGAVRSVQRKAGTAVLITYHAYSAVNPVTGKVANEEVERYTFWRGGAAVSLTLAAPVGSDNVDPWRKVTDSFTWTQ